MTTNNAPTLAAPVPTLAARWRAATPYLHSVLRVITGFLFLQYGTAKLFAFPAEVLPGGGTAEIFSLTGAAGILETFGGLLLLAGLFTRPVAFILSGQMAVAYFMFHAPQGFWPLLNDGEGAVLYCFIFLFLASVGGGPWSVDRWLRMQRDAGKIAV